MKVLTENNLKPEKCLYFDDVQANIDVANNLGIKSYLFVGMEQAKAVLIKENIL